MKRKMTVDAADHSPRGPRFAPTTPPANHSRGDDEEEEEEEDGLEERTRRGLRGIATLSGWVSRGQEAQEEEEEKSRRCSRERLAGQKMEHLKRESGARGKDAVGF